MLTDKVAHALLNLGTKRAMVVHGMDGLDEITITRESRVSEVKDGGVRTYFIDPRDFGLDIADASVIKGGTARQNASITKEILSGRKGAVRDIVLLNAGAAIYVGGKAADLAGGIKLAAESIDTGAAMKKLEYLAALSGELAGK